MKRCGASWRKWSWAVIPGEPLFLAEVQTWVVGASKFLHPELIFVDRRAVHIYACVGPSALLTTITDGLDDRTTIYPQSDLSVSTPVLCCCHVYLVRLQIPHDHAGCKRLLWSFSFGDLIERNSSQQRKRHLICTGANSREDLTELKCATI